MWKHKQSPEPESNDDPFDAQLDSDLDAAADDYIVFSLGETFDESVLESH